MAPPERPHRLSRGPSKTERAVEDMIMRKLLLVAIVAWAWTGTPLCAQSVQSDRDTLQRLSMEWMDAVAHKDRAALERLLAPDFQLVSVGDVRGGVGRAQWLENALRMDWQNRGYSGVRIEINGDVGIVTSNYTFRVDPGKWKPAITATSPVVDVWVRRGGRWQIQRRHLACSTLTRWVDRVLGFAIAAAFCLGVLLLRRLAPGAWPWGRRYALR